MDERFAGVGRRIAAARRGRGWTQAELAEKIGIAVEHAGRLERGVALPSLPTLLALADTLGVSLGEFTSEPTSLPADPLLAELVHLARGLSARDLGVLVAAATAMSGVSAAKRKAS